MRCASRFLRRLRGTFAVQAERGYSTRARRLATSALRKCAPLPMPAPDPEWILLTLPNGAHNRLCDACRAASVASSVCPARRWSRSCPSVASGIMVAFGVVDRPSGSPASQLTHPYQAIQRERFPFLCDASVSAMTLDRCIGCRSLPCQRQDGHLKGYRLGRPLQTVP